MRSGSQPDLHPAVICDSCS